MLKPFKVLCLRLYLHILLIHLADPQSQTVGIEQDKQFFQVKVMFTVCLTVEMAEWIVNEP